MQLDSPAATGGDEWAMVTSKNVKKRGSGGGTGGGTRGDPRARGTSGDVLYISQLPIDVTEPKLREAFARVGVVPNGGSGKLDVAVRQKHDQAGSLLMTFAFLNFHGCGDGGTSCFAALQAVMNNEIYVRTQMGWQEWWAIEHAKQQQ
jgi:hypothetical protein